MEAGREDGMEMEAAESRGRWSKGPDKMAERKI